MYSDKLKTFLPALLLALAGFVLAYQFVDPAPPSSLSIAAGQPGGAYYSFAEQLRDRLAPQGITLQIRQSAGSLDNIKRLEQGTADIGYVQSGLTGADSTLESLGSMYYEPLWIFLAPGVDDRLLRDMQGLRLAGGQAGSGTYALTSMLLAENAINTHNATWLQLSDRDAADALLDGKADVAFMVGAATAGAIARLAATPGIRLMPLLRAEAYARRHRTITALTLPRGTLNPAADMPSTDTTMRAAAATLLINPSLHPALQDLLLQAAVATHDKSSLFTTAGRFPSPGLSGQPLSLSASRYYKSGPTFLQRYLPFWAATLVDRLKLMLLPFLALLVPLFKLMPPLYRWRIRSRIYRCYEDLTRLDHSLRQALPAEELDGLLAELHLMEEEIRKINVPLSYADELYDLRLHLAMVREQVEKVKG